MPIHLLLIPLFMFSISCAGQKETAGDRQTLVENQIQMSVASVRRGNFKQALKDIDKARDLDRNNPEIYFVYGIIYYALNDYDKAEENYKRALRLNSEYSEARFNLCGLYLRTESYDRAREQCRHAATDPLYQNRAAAFTNIGIAYFSQGDVNRAKENYDQALRINPSYPYTRNELGKLYLSIGNLQRAINEFRLAIDIFPGYDEAYFNLANAYLKSGDELSACHSFKKVVEMSSNNELVLQSRDYIDTICTRKMN